MSARADFLLAAALSKDPPPRAKQNQIVTMQPSPPHRLAQQLPPLHPGSASASAATTSPATPSRSRSPSGDRESFIHPTLTGAVTTPNVQRSKMITAQPFISPIPSTKTPRDSPLSSPAGAGHITVYGLQMVDADGGLSSRDGDSARGGSQNSDSAREYDELGDRSVVDVCPSPVVSPLPKMETARGGEEELDEMRGMGKVLQEETDHDGKVGLRLI